MAQKNMSNNPSESILVFPNNGTNIYVDPTLKPTPDCRVIVKNEYGVTIEDFNDQSPLTIVGVVIPSDSPEVVSAINALNQDDKQQKLEALKRSIGFLQLDDIDESQLDKIINILNLKAVTVKGASMNFEPD